MAAFFMTSFLVAGSQYNKALLMTDCYFEELQWYCEYF